MALSPWFGLLSDPFLVSIGTNPLPDLEVPKILPGPRGRELTANWDLQHQV